MVIVDRFCVAALGMVLLCVRAGLAADLPADWTKAHLSRPMTAAETRGFMKKLALFVEQTHLKKKESSPQKGMLYEYMDMRRVGQVDQFVQGEALDTMHDGAWYAVAMVAAYRATGDEYYKNFLMQWQLPFYLKMLNHSDELFSPQRDDSAPGANHFNKEHLLQKGEKGFVPYFWDDGGSVSLERRQKKQALGTYSCRDNLAGQNNPNFLLDGYSLGSSNHLAQDLGVMIQQAWLLMREDSSPQGQKLAPELAEAAKNLEACRTNHGYTTIPAVLAPAALCSGSAELLKRLPDPNDAKLYIPSNHYTQCLSDFKPGQRISIPGFADDQEYRYFSGIARAGGELPKPLAFKLIYDAYTNPMLYRIYSDDAPVPAGVNGFDLHPIYFKDGKPEDYRSEKKGPAGKPRPMGSRFGPQNMVVCGWGLQALEAYPKIWEDPDPETKDASIVGIDDGTPARENAGAKVRIYLGNFSDYGPGKLTVSKSSTRTALSLHGTVAASAPLIIKIFSQPKGSGTHAIITLEPNKSIKAVNDAGRVLIATGSTTPKDKGFDYKVTIPYGFDKGQFPWLNGIEHGRYSIQFNDYPPMDFYLTSTDDQVHDWLEYHLSAGLLTWQAIFTEKGYIPSGIGTGREMDYFSDTGAYAHLIHAAAQYLLYLDKKSDWSMQHIPTLR